jgi:hypothetical protein
MRVVQPWVLVVRSGRPRDTEVFEVSPTAELNKVIEVVMGNLGPNGFACPLPDRQ